MKKILVLIVLVFQLVACDKSQDAGFDLYKDKFVNNFWDLNPGYASSQGLRKYDSILKIPNLDNRNKQLAFIKSALDSLEKFDFEKLSENNKTDFLMLENQLESMTFYTNTFKSWQWDPSEYNVCGNFSEILANETDKLEVKLKNLNQKSLRVSTYYASAQQNIKNPTLEHTKLAIDQNLGGMSIFITDLPDSIKKSSLLEVEKTAFLVNAKNACKAVNDYVNFLKKIDNKTPNSFRIGKDLYDKKFNLDIQSSYSADEVFKKAVLHKTNLHQKMFVLSEKLWTKYMGETPKPSNKLEQIKAVIDKISVQHTTPENFQIAIEKQIPELTAFVKQKNLLYIDPSKPLVVRKEPAYMAGVAGASISAPGPYDINGKTFYNVGSMSGWSKAKSESYLKEYNDYILQILNIHEAIPGHYTQLVYSNQSPSIIKSIFGNGTMIEGWAVYTEIMMLENGYKNSDEMWLMYYKWNLRSTCNTILDIAVHTKNWSKEQVLDLLINQAFQQQTEADGKWNRATLTQVQLCSYYTGFAEIYDFREGVKKLEGNKFNLKTFHERFLSFGSAPIKHIKALYNKQ